MSKNNDDVLDFINSLPDSRSGTPKPKGGPKDKKDGQDEDFLEFLDELAQHEKKKPSTPKPERSKFEPKKKKDEEKDEESKPTADTETTKEATDVASTETKDAAKELEIDPIGSISNWWSSEGSNKVSSLWGTITSNAEKLGEQTYQLASTTTNQLNQQRQKILEEGADAVGVSADQHVGNLTSRLNSMLVTMSNQIKQGLISQDDELLNVLVIYDMYNMHYLDQLAYENFSHVMTQVEGGIRVSVNKINHNDSAPSAEDYNVNLNMFHGKVIDGEKLCFANLESSIKDYQKLEEQNGKDIEKKESQEKGKEKYSEEKITKSDMDQINKSNVFISVQPITTRLERDTPEPESDSDKPTLIDSNNQDSFAFTIILKDITNDITIITKTQAFPLKWARWLAGEYKADDPEQGDVDPSEWVRDWIRNGLDLSFGVIAQEYVIKRMGI